MLVGISHSIGIATKLVEGFLDISGPGQNVDQKNSLGNTVLDPVEFGLLRQLLEQLTSNVLKRGAHRVNNILHVGLDFAHQFEDGGPWDVLDTDICVHTDSGGADSLLLELQSLNSLENLGHVNHDLSRSVTVGKDIKQIGG